VILRGVFEAVLMLNSPFKYPHLKDLVEIFKMRVFNRLVENWNSFKNAPRNRYFLTFSFFGHFLKNPKICSKINILKTRFLQDEALVGGKNQGE